MKTPFKQYQQLTKPGIIRGNVLAATAGFLLASARHHSFNAWLFLALIIGTSLVIAAACVCNNYIDRGIDTRMTRTKGRALVTGSIQPHHALLFGGVLALLGFGILAGYTSTLVLIIGAVAFSMYVIAYGYFKRRTYWGTLIGCVPGALPLVAGYAAVTERIDTAAILLFLIMVFWQMPHFYAIALYRLKDYKAAGLPVFPVVHSARTTKLQVLSFIGIFIGLNATLTLLGYTGIVYLIVMTVLGLIWFWKGLQSFQTKSDELWGKSMFLFSLVIILSLSCMLSIGSLLA